MIIQNEIYEKLRKILQETGGDSVSISTYVKEVKEKHTFTLEINVDEE
jgi:hypothetical protein